MRILITGAGGAAAVSVWKSLAPSTSCTWPTWIRWPPASISCRRTAA